MEPDKLSDAVETCLACAVGTDQPFKRVADYLASLKIDPKWTEAEIIEVQTRVIRALMKRTT